MDDKTFYDFLFLGFDGYEEVARGVKRYQSFDRMIHRTTLWEHGPMVAWVAESMYQSAQKANSSFSRENQWETTVCSLVHDNPEFIDGIDIPTSEKERWNKEQRSFDDLKTEGYIDTLCERWPSHLGGVSYKEVLDRSHRKDTYGAQLGSYADKCVGIFEAIHELRAGNGAFGSVVMSGAIPVRTYEGKFRKRRSEWPLLSSLFDLGSSENPLIFIPKPIDIELMLESANPHTLESIRMPTGHQIYDNVMKVLLDRGGEFMGSFLTEQRE